MTNRFSTFEVGINDQHPPPWAEDEAKAGPSTTQFWPELRETSQRANSTLEALLRVLRQAVGQDQTVKVLRGGPGKLDPGQGD